MTDSNMPTDKKGKELYLNARKLQALEVLALILNNDNVTAALVAEAMWAKIEEIETELSE
ncbi:MAG: hypothetical protein V3R25_06045 [Nitrosomonadaceae bacterium]